MVSDVLTPPQLVISYLLNAMIGETVTSRSEFEKRHINTKKGQPDSLLVHCVKWFFKNGDFTDFMDQIEILVKGQNLAEFCNSYLQYSPELIRHVAIHAENKSRKIRVLIRSEDFAVCTENGRLVSFQFTEDMEEPAASLAEYTKILFDHPKYNIEFAFDGRHGSYRNMELAPIHIKLLSKLRPEHFAERGQDPCGRERSARLTVRMSRIAFYKSGIYYNAILDFFSKYRAVVYNQGEVPICDVKRSYEDILEHTLTYPEDWLMAVSPCVDPLASLSMKKRRMCD